MNQEVYSFAFNRVLRELDDLIVLAADDNNLWLQLTHTKANLLYAAPPQDTRRAPQRSGGAKLGSFSGELGATMFPHKAAEDYKKYVEGTVLEGDPGDEQPQKETLGATILDVFKAESEYNKKAAWRSFERISDECKAIEEASELLGRSAARYLQDELIPAAISVVNATEQARTMHLPFPPPAPDFRGTWTLENGDIAIIKYLAEGYWHGHREGMIDGWQDYWDAEGNHDSNPAYRLKERHREGARHK